MTIDEILHLLEHDPESVIRLREVRTPEVFAAWIRRVLSLTSANPREGLPHVETAMGITLTSCDVVQCFGVKAAAHRNLGELDEAQDALDHAFRFGRSCAACNADLLRRRAILLASKGMQSEALADADAAIEAHAALPWGHSLVGHALAHCYLGRGDIRQYFGADRRNDTLIQGALADFGEALALVNPLEHQSLYYPCLLNIGVVLRQAGGLANLSTANDYIREAAKYFKARQDEPSRERAYLDWQTSMVRFELRRHPEGKQHVTESPYYLRKRMVRSRNDFLYVKLPFEASAVVSDLARVVYPKRSDIKALMKDSIAQAREALKGYTPELRQAFHPVWDAMQAVKQAADADVLPASSVATSTLEFNAGLRAKIEQLRELAQEAAGSKALPCLLAWPKQSPASK